MSQHIKYRMTERCTSGAILSDAAASRFSLSFSAARSSAVRAFLVSGLPSSSTSGMSGLCFAACSSSYLSSGVPWQPQCYVRRQLLTTDILQMQAIAIL